MTHSIRLLGLLVLPGLLVVLPACSHGHYNPHTRGPGGEGTLMDHAERLIEQADQALDKLDARLENRVW